MKQLVRPDANVTNTKRYIMNALSSNLIPNYVVLWELIFTYLL